MAQMHKSTTKADEAVKFEDGCFDRIKAAMPTGDAPMSDGSKPGAPNADVSPDQQNAEQNKLHLKRYLDSLLRLSTKLKTLRREMKDHYTPDHIAKLDREYDILNEEMAKGENAKFGPEPMWWKVAHKKMNDATFVFETQRSSRATAAEQKVKQAPQKSKQFFDKKDTEKNEEPGRITKKKKREQHENNAPAVEVVFTAPSRAKLHTDPGPGPGLRSFVKEIGHGVHDLADSAMRYGCPNRKGSSTGGPRGSKVQLGALSGYQGEEC
ncbi:unnamed protein product [Cladocopium goreaui]|uniref:Uncharacterized protein n=1 Tax=Cladocopium goreaui TaxID=2562237 RepID=A0A9P1FRS9_9DINO|nr:unnamed protein product [Cladocopium goreaui]